MKHVWILNHYAQEPDGAGGTRHFSLARHLPAYGWNATIIAASTDHGTGEQRLLSGEKRRLQSYDGVPFLWLGARNYSGNGADRVGNMIDYTRQVLQDGSLAGIQPPDVVVGSSVHPFAAWAGRRLAKRYRVPFAFEVRDLWPQTLIDMGRLSHYHPAAIALRLLERSLYRDAARIIVLLPKANEYIEPLGLPKEKIVWVPNGVDVERFPVTPQNEGREGFTLMYFGAHGGANGLDNLLAAMRVIRDECDRPDIVLRLIGDGPLKESLQATARSMGLNNVRFEDPVQKSAIPALAAQADAFVFNLIDAPVFRYGISSNKLFDFMAAGRPVLFCSAASNNPISESGCGITVPPENPRVLATAILELASAPLTRRAEMGAAGRLHLIENYDMNRLSGRFAAALDSCLGGA